MWLYLFWITFGLLTLLSTVICYAGCVAAKRADRSLRIAPYAEQPDYEEQNTPHATIQEATFSPPRS